MSDVTRLPIDAIHFDRSFYPRFGLDAERITVLRDLYASEGEGALPPLEVVLIQPDLALGADGAHRQAAARLLRWTHLPVRLIAVPTGYEPEEIAYLRGLEMAVAAAKPLTRAERRAAAEHLLTDHPDWSDREIGRRAGVSHTTVGALRERGERDEVADGSELYLAATSAERIAATLVRGVEKAWDARGITDLVMGRLPGTLAAALRRQFGDDAEEWAGRLEQWALDARRALEQGKA